MLGLAVAIAFGIVPLQAISVFAATDGAKPPTPTPTEIRGVWLTNVGSDLLFVPGAVSRALQELSELNFNTVYPVVWNRGQTFYPSAISKRMTGRSQDWLLSLMRGNTDVFAETIAEAHRQGLNVMAWFEYGFMAPANSQIVLRHPDWITQHRDRTENLQANEVTPEVLENRLDIELVWLNPLHPEVQKFLLNLIIEVAVNYDIDGIQFDDNFGLPVELGYDPFTVELYRQEHWGYPPPDNPYDWEWVRWRAEKITQFVQRIHQAVNFVNPNCSISLATNSQSFSYRHYLQDWLTWVELGLIDELFLQVYHEDLNRFKAELDIGAVWYARQLTRVGVGILSGTYKRRIAIADVEDRVKVARDRGFAGFAFFYWESLWGSVTPDPPEDRRSAFQAMFSQPASPPQIHARSF